MHDGLPHQIQILIKGKALTLKIDNYESQTVVNSGPKETFNLTTKNFLYVGGVPSTVGIRATTAFHLKQAHSFKGEDHHYLLFNLSKKLFPEEKVAFYASSFLKYPVYGFFL